MRVKAAYRSRAESSGYGSCNGINRRTLNPEWNEDFRIEVSNDADLQNEPLEIKVMDYDQITYGDAIGAVFIDLNPLLAWESSSRDSNSLSGWFPIFDSLRGICGDIFISVRLNFFGDSNQYSDSSTSVQFFTSPFVPVTYIVTTVFNYVSTLEREDDPEFHWADNFRTPRTSNDARMRLCYKLSGQLRRQLGKKVLDLGGNAVLGYKQYFDFETEQRCITARAMGTAVTLATPEQILTSMLHTSQISVTGGIVANGSLVDRVSSSDNAFETASIVIPGSTNGMTARKFSGGGGGGGFSSSQIPQTPAQASSTNRIIQTSHESPLSSPTDSNFLPPPALQLSQPNVIKHIDQFPVTLTAFPTGAIKNLGGLVSAASVKILDNSSDSKETRESWWAELRDEIKSHARSLKCPLILGYTENITLCNELAVLYCYGTAAVVDFSAFSNIGLPSNSLAAANLPPLMREKAGVRGASFSESIGDDGDGYFTTNGNDSSYTPLTPGIAQRKTSTMLYSSTIFDKIAKLKRKKRKNPGCQACHIAYSRAESTFQSNMTFTRCGVCRKKFVPEIILSTIEPPAELDTIGKSVMVEAHVCRIKKSRVGESHAVVVSESMPFAQYDIHRQLLFKLRIQGLNAIFGLKIQYSIGESLMTAVATGTAVYLKALPPPPALKLLRTLDVVDGEDRQLLEEQRRIMEESEYNRKQIELALAQEQLQAQNFSMDSISARSEKRRTVNEAVLKEDGNVKDLTASNVDIESESESEDSVSSGSDSEFEVTNRQRNVVVQIDDEHDEDLVLLMDTKFREGFHMKNIETAVKADAFADRNNVYTVQSITMIRHGLIPLSSHHPNRQLARLFNDLYQELQFQLSYVPECTIFGIDYDVQVVKLNEIQIRLTAVALGLETEDIDDHSQTDLDEFTRSFCVSDGRESSPTRKSFSKGNLGERRLTNASLQSTIESEQVTGENNNNESDESSEEEEDLVYSDDDDDAVKLATAVPLTITATTSSSSSSAESSPIPPPISLNPVSEFLKHMNEPATGRQAISGGLVSSTTRQAQNMTSLVQMPRAIEITPLSFVPQGRIEKFLGRVSLHFVKEASILYEPGSVVGGMGGFSHTLLAELYSVARSYTAALGGNAMILFTMETCMIYESIKNQG
ncbi:hypothetical protein HK100_000413, partial [Physocladia obscura]